MRRELLLLLALCSALVLLMAAPAWGAETEPVTSPLVATLFSAPGRLVGAALVVALVEAFKQWRDRVKPPEPSAAWPIRWAYVVLMSPVGRMLVALVVSLPAAAAAWGSGADLQDAGYLLATTWIGSMGLNAAFGAAFNQKARDLPGAP